MNEPRTDLLIESAVTAFRERDADGHLRAAGAWWDLDAAGRERLFATQQQARELERALDPLGASSTIRAVLERIERP